MSEENWNLINQIRPVSRETYERFTIYHDCLLHWQKQINLIAPSTQENIWRRHIADSVQIPALCDGMGEEVNGQINHGASHVVDIGSGAGFPGLIYGMIMMDELYNEKTTLQNKTAMKKRLDLVESNGKKCAFLNTVIRETGLKQAGLEVHVHHGRIEQILPQIASCFQKNSQNGLSVVTARALASLTRLFEWTEEFITNDTVALFPKGRDYQKEIEEAEKKWNFLVDAKQSQIEADSVLLKISCLKRL